MHSSISMNMLHHSALLVTAAVVFCAASVKCYDFDDVAYNQILAEDLEELYYLEDLKPLNVRNRRDEESVTADKDRSKCHPHHKMKFLCCGKSLLDELHFEGQRRECWKELSKNGKHPRPMFDPFRCENANKFREHMTCMMQCIYQKKNLLDKDGNPQEAEFASLVNEILGKESWTSSLQDKIIPTCLAEAQNASSDRDASDSETCNPAGLKLGHCLFREIQLNCPVEEIKDVKACSRLRERLEKSNDFFPGHPPPPEEDD